MSDRDLVILALWIQAVVAPGEEFVVIPMSFRCRGVGVGGIAELLIETVCGEAEDGQEGEDADEAEEDLEFEPFAETIWSLKVVGGSGFGEMADETKHFRQV